MSDIPLTCGGVTTLKRRSWPLLKLVILAHQRQNLWSNWFQGRPDNKIEIRAIYLWKPGIEAKCALHKIILTCRLRFLSSLLRCSHLGKDFILDFMDKNTHTRTKQYQLHCIPKYFFVVLLVDWSILTISSWWSHLVHIASLHVHPHLMLLTISELWTKQLID